MGKIVETVWDLEAHTAKKHEILRRHFQAWLPILANSNQRLLYIDAFAGPGEYSKGEDGSPLVVLKAARDHVFKFESELVCLFIEDNRGRYEHLVQVLDRLEPTLPKNVKFRHLHGKFNEHIDEVFADVDEQRKRDAPTLAFLDPFGFSHTPFSAISRLMKYPKTEVLVNFMYEEINRFLSNPDFAGHFDAQFGTSEWRNAIDICDPVQRLAYIHDLYLRQLETVSRYVRSFEMVNKSNTADYFLFFATKSLKGLEAMKYAMWKADPAGEFVFSDFTDSKKQIPLFAAEPDYLWLREIITDEFAHIEIEIEALGDWVVENTPFLRTHLKKQILASMEEEGAIKVVSAKPGRRRFTYPEGTVIKFLGGQRPLLP